MFALFEDIDVKCGYLGARNHQHERLSEMLAFNQITLLSEMSFQSFGDLSRGEAESYDFLFIDVEALGGIVKIFDMLASLRIKYSSVPVILISEDFEVDVFDTTRQVLCDVSLRTPILYASLEMALFEATKNNLNRLKSGQQEVRQSMRSRHQYRERQEVKARENRIRGGLMGLWDRTQIKIGVGTLPRFFAAEIEAAKKRDDDEFHAVKTEQVIETQQLQKSLRLMEEKHRKERNSARVSRSYWATLDRSPLQNGLQDKQTGRRAHQS
jgi:hypothetical protein